MNIEKNLRERAQVCELCAASAPLKVYEVPPHAPKSADDCLLACPTCYGQITKEMPLDAAHWRCLSDSMWSEIPAVQVVAWRMLNRLKQESWAQEALDMLYLDEERLAWAQAVGEEEDAPADEPHKDCNGAVLQTGDSVVLIKSLDVKGSSVNAKIGTPVRNIRLVADNNEQIEGKIDGQTIVILTKYVRKSS